MFEGKFVIVRTYSAGVHCGVLTAINGTEVVLTNARRIFQWKADNIKPRTNTLNEIALRGVSRESRVSQPVDEILVTQAIEVIPCTKEARENLENSRWS